MRARDVTDLAGHSLGREALLGKRAFLASGLARPEIFRATVESLGAEVVGECRFGDHHAFTPADLEAIAARARHAGASAIAVTAKDAAKLEALPAALAPAPGALSALELRVVHIQLELLSGEEVLEAALDEVLAR